MWNCILPPWRVFRSTEYNLKVKSNCQVISIVPWPFECSILLFKYAKKSHLLAKPFPISSHTIWIYEIYVYNTIHNIIFSRRTWGASMEYPNIQISSGAVVSQIPPILFLSYSNVSTVISQQKKILQTCNIFFTADFLWLLCSPDSIKRIWKMFVSCYMQTPLSKSE